MATLEKTKFLFLDRFVLIKDKTNRKHIRLQSMNAFLHVDVVLVVDYVWNSDVFIMIARIRIYVVLITLSG